MILKCIREATGEGITINRLYPAIGYNIGKNSHSNIYYIFDDVSSLSWRQDNRFILLSSNPNNYIMINEDETCFEYVYKELADKTFLTNFYSEDEKSIKARLELENILISIYVDELTIDELVSYIKETDNRDYNLEYFFKAFFEKADLHEVRNLAEILYGYISIFDANLIQLIVEKLSNYKDVVIENLFMELYLNYPFCNMISKTLIENYLGM